MCAVLREIMIRDIDDALALYRIVRGLMTSVRVAATTPRIATHASHQWDLCHMTTSIITISVKERHLLILTLLHYC